MVQTRPPSDCAGARCLISSICASCDLCDSSASARAIDRVNLRWAAGAPPFSNSPPFLSVPPTSAASLQPADGLPLGMGKLRTASGVEPSLLLAFMFAVLGVPPSPRGWGRLLKGCLKNFKISTLLCQVERPAGKPKSWWTTFVFPGVQLCISCCPGRAIGPANWLSVACPDPPEFLDPPSSVRRVLILPKNITLELAQGVLSRPRSRRWALGGA